MKRWVIGAAIVIAVIVGAILIGRLTAVMRDNATLTMGGKTFHAVILDNDQTRIQGLSGTKSLPADRAMLFVFDKVGIYPFWMKDMNYPIDMVWLSQSGRVVYMVSDAQPSSYDKADPAKSTLYNTNTRALYVIETVSGTIKETGLKDGDIVTLPSGI